MDNISSLVRQNENRFQYQLLHKNSLVLEISSGEVTVASKEKLPFDLRHYETVGYAEWLNWLKRRIDTLQRTYMNQLYKQRRLGRGHVEVINDSNAISPIDLFWIKAGHHQIDWESLQEKRDFLMSTALTSLEGKLDPKAMFGKKEDRISILTTKGTFPKAIYQNHLLKKGDNAEYEISGYRIAEHLGIPSAKAFLGEDNIVYCELFTNDKLGMVHALEYIYPFDAETYADIYTRSLALFSGNAEINHGIQRLFIFSYLISNNDLHGENFGFLYDNETFNIVSIAPAYDFNAAFDAWGDPTLYDPTIMNNLEELIKNNPDIIAKLATLPSVVKSDAYLSEEQKQEILIRAEYLLLLYKQKRGAGI